MDPTVQQVATTLGLTVEAVLNLMNNPAFPPPTSGSGLTASWSSIAAFQALWTATLANGWKISTAALPTFNFAWAAAHAPGQYYQPANTDPLFDA